MGNICKSNASSSVVEPANKTETEPVAPQDPTTSITQPQVSNVAISQSAESESASSPPPTTTAAPAQQQQQQQQQQHQPPAAPPSPPLIFAIMRNGHEVIRGAMKHIHTLLFEEENADAAAQAYRDLKVWCEMHKIMEEGRGGPSTASSNEPTPKGFFTVLDEHFDDIVKKENLREDHVNLESAEQALEKALSLDPLNLQDIQQAFTNFQAINEAHLVKEEGIMMPHIPKLKEKGINLKELMNQQLLALIVDTSDYPFFVQYANRVLEKMNKIVVFDQALMACATPEQHPIWESWIKESLQPHTYEEVMKAVHYKF